MLRTYVGACQPQNRAISWLVERALVGDSGILEGCLSLEKT